MKSLAIPLAATLGLLCAPAAFGQTVYSNNFDSAPVVQPGVVASFAGGSTIATDPVYNPTYGNIWRNDGNTFATATTLTLSNLPAHTAVSLSFLMAFLNSWDSTNGSPSPDFLDVWIDGVQVGNYTYNNAGGNVINIGGGTLVAQYVQFDTNYFYSDSVVDMSSDPTYSFAHTGSTLTVQWLASGSGWQFLDDEGYGVDNIVVRVAGVPEPSTWALLLLGVGAVGGRALRRR